MERQNTSIRVQAVLRALKEASQSVPLLRDPHTDTPLQKTTKKKKKHRRFNHRRSDCLRGRQVSMLLKLDASL